MNKYKIGKIRLVLCYLALLSAWGSARVSGITHSSFADFSAGTLGDSGVNLYVSREGSVQMIHRWDLNSDGHLDLFVSQDHNKLENAEVLVYWGSAQGPASLMPPIPHHQPMARLLRLIREREAFVTRLPGNGGGRSIVADLNGDGYPDLIFCNFIHNYSVHTMAYIYWGGPRGYDPDRRTELPTLLAEDVAAADFNRDGFIDLAFANHGNELGERFGYDNNLESYIYWNGPTGFEADKRSSLPTISAAACATGDLDGDGWPELIFANNDAKVSSIYIYRGSAEGFSETRRRIIEGGDPVGLKLTDINGDSHLDLVVLHEDDRAVVFLGTIDGLASQPWVELPVSGAIEAEAGDLNGDGFIDLVFPNASGDFSYIYWGEPSGFQISNRLELPTLHAADVALADFNQDGLVDLVFANEHDEESHDINSYLYWNGPEGFNAGHRTELFGFGPVSTVAADMNADGHTDLALINRNSGSYKPVDSLIYWGNPSHHYSSASVSDIPGFVGGTVPAIADFDNDGYPDIGMPNGWVYYGSAEGYLIENRREISGGGKFRGYGASTADINRDGYLDLLITAIPVDDDSPPRLLAFWGGENGFDGENRFELPLGTDLTPPNVAIADLNKDGYLDLLMPPGNAVVMEIYWGSAQGYTPRNRQQLEVNPAVTIEFADFNSDGWLDLILGGARDRTQLGNPTRMASILWGSPDGISQDRASSLEAYNALEQSVADLNKDGNLDIVMTNYQADHTRTIPVFIYWGAADGTYSESRRSTLPAESSSALTVADLNQDDWLDLVVFNHVRDGDHGAGANIFWGGPDGYDYSRRHWLQTFGPHFGVRTDIGNIYDRRLEETFLSAPVRIPSGEKVVELSWKAHTPHGTSIRFQIRTAERKDGLDAAPWKGPGDGNDFFTKTSSPISYPRNHSWIQYRAILATPDGGSTPVLEEVTLETK